MGGWAGLWIGAADGKGLTGIAASIEHDGFTGVSVATGVGRFRLGPVWQIQVGQVWISSLFDDALLEEAPGLADLATRASYAGLDATAEIIPRIWGAVGARYEIDLLLGDRASGAVLRTSLAAAAGALSVGVSLERSPGSDAFRPGTGVVNAGLAVRKRVIAVAAGVEIGRLWLMEDWRTALGLSSEVLIGEVLELKVGGGAERYETGGDNWIGYAAVGLGLRFGAAGLHVRYSGIGTGESNPLGASFAWTRFDPDRK